MSIGKIWKTIAELIAGGERDEERLANLATDAIFASGESRKAVYQLALKRVRDMISGTVKPSGMTSRVPAGQQALPWYDLEPSFAIARLRRQIKLAYKAMARAKLHAEVLGIIDASGLEPTAFESFGAMMVAANVPEELIAAFAA